jgi:3-keto-L-gulonate-6-phosphate decarboxylase
MSTTQETNWTDDPTVCRQYHQHSGVADAKACDVIALEGRIAALEAALTFVATVCTTSTYDESATIKRMRDAATKALA